MGYGIVRSLRQCRHAVKIVGIDIFDDAVGQHWTDEFRVAVRTDSKEYPEFLESILQEYDIDLFIPGIEQDVSFLADYRRRSPGTRGTFALNNPNLIRTSDDKWLMHQALVAASFPSIETCTDGSFDELAKQLGCPMLVKPRRSYAGKGIHIVEDATDFNYWRAKMTDNFIAQKIIGSIDEEYTVAAFGYGDGSCSRPIAFKRKLSGEGTTVKIKVVEQTSPEFLKLQRWVKDLTKLFTPIGPTNFQFRKDGDQFLLLEINARISSSSSLRTAFGYNEPEMCLEFFLQGLRPEPQSEASGQAVRYLEDLVTYARHNS